MLDESINEISSPCSRKNSLPTQEYLSLAQKSPNEFSDSLYTNTKTYNHNQAKVRKGSSLDNKNARQSLNKNMPMKKQFTHDLSTKIAEPKLFKENYPETCLKLDKTTIMQQEVINEFLNTEKKFINDLSKKLINAHMKTLSTFKIISETDIKTLFFRIEDILEQGRLLLAELEKSRLPNGCIFNFPQIFQKWIENPILSEIYISYIQNQVSARELYDYLKSTNPKFENFLDRSISSLFSQKLDIWSYIDRPRGRLANYKVLLATLDKNMPEKNLQKECLTNAIASLGNLMDSTDSSYSNTETLHFKRKIFANSDMRDKLDEFLSKSKSILIHGETTFNNHKTYSFLFNNGLVLTKRRQRKSEKHESFELYRFPFTYPELEAKEHADLNKIKVSYVDKNSADSYDTSTWRKRDLKNLFKKNKNKVKKEASSPAKVQNNDSFSSGYSSLPPASQKKKLEIIISLEDALSAKHWLDKINSSRLTKPGLQSPILRSSSDPQTGPKIIVSRHKKIGSEPTYTDSDIDSNKNSSSRPSSKVTIDDSITVKTTSPKPAHRKFIRRSHTIAGVSEIRNFKRPAEKTKRSDKVISSEWHSSIDSMSTTNTDMLDIFIKNSQFHT